MSQFLLKFYPMELRIYFKYQKFHLCLFYFNFFDIHMFLIYYHAKDMQFFLYYKKLLKFHKYNNHFSFHEVLFMVILLYFSASPSKV